MLTVNEIQQFIGDDNASQLKHDAREGERYYDGLNDILQYRMFYYNADGEIVEDKTRSNMKIPHLFYRELVDQGTQYMLSDTDMIKSDIPELQDILDEYFNNNQDFIAELTEAVTGCQRSGFSYMYAYRNADNKISFQCADSIGVVEVRAKDTDSDADHVIYWYNDRLAKSNKLIKRIQVWDAQSVYFYVQDNEGVIVPDDSEKLNPRPHTLYKRDKKVLYKGFGFIPFFRLDNNKKKLSNLKPIKALIDDYDLMASSLSNNLVDFDTPLHVVKGFEGDNFDELQTNLKTKKIIGVGDEGDVDVKTVNVPYEARVAKLELDEKNIYRFGMGLNTAGLKDTSATTNIAIKAAYSLLDLRCSQLEIRLKQFLNKLVKVVLDDINETEVKDYQLRDVYYSFTHNIMSNALENAQIELINAQRQQTNITTLLNIAQRIDDETLMQLICEQLDISYEDIKDKLPDVNEADNSINSAMQTLKDVSIDE